MIPSDLKCNFSGRGIKLKGLYDSNTVNFTDHVTAWETVREISVTIIGLPASDGEAGALGRQAVRSVREAGCKER